jgi:hypothetical protein
VPAGFLEGRIEDRVFDDDGFHVAILPRAVWRRAVAVARVSATGRGKATKIPEREEGTRSIAQGHDGRMRVRQACHSTFYPIRLYR